MTFGRHYRLMDKADDKGGAGGSGEDENLDRGDALDISDLDDDDSGAAAKAAEEKAAAEAEKKAADEAQAAADKKDVRIPKDRFDEAVGKERERAAAAEAKAQELEARLAQQDRGVDVKALLGEIDELEEQLEAQMAEGTPEKRRELRKQIREKQETISDAKANARAVEATAIAVEQIRYDAVVEKMEVEYPFLNPDDAEKFDKNIAGELVELKSAYEALGMASSQALVKATKTLKSGLDAAKKALEKPAAGDEQDEDLTAEEKAAAAEEKAKAAVKKAAESATAKVAEEKAAKRREEAVTKGLKAKGEQPAAAAHGKADKEVKEINVKTMTDKQLDELPEPELKRLRGDSL